MKVPCHNPILLSSLTHHIWFRLSKASIPRLQPPRAPWSYQCSPVNMPTLPLVPTPHITPSFLSTAYIFKGQPPKFRFSLHRLPSQKARVPSRPTPHRVPSLSKTTQFSGHLPRRYLTHLEPFHSETLPSTPTQKRFPLGFLVNIL